MLKPGDQAPDFTCKDHEGNTVSLRDYKGKSLVLWFFPKADTPGCTIEGCGFRDLKAEFEKHNAPILGVSFAPPAQNAAFAGKSNFNYPVLTYHDCKIGLV